MLRDALRTWLPGLGLLLLIGGGLTIVQPTATRSTADAGSAAASEPTAAAPRLETAEERDARAWLRASGGSEGEAPAVSAARAELAAALDAHRFPAAIAAAERVLASHPQDRPALMLLSDALVELGRVDEAEAALQRVLDLRPDAAAYFRAGWLFHLRGEDRAACDTLDLALEAARLSPPAARAWILTERGNLARAAGRLEEAEASYAEALRLSPRWPAAHVGRARAALAAGDAWEAARVLEETRPTVEVLGLLARARRALGQTAAADQAAARGVAMGVGDAHDGRALALLLSDEGLEPERAVRLARAEVEARPGPQAWDALGWALLRAGQPTEALAAAERALGWGTREPELLWHAGLAARAANDPRAADWLDQAAALDPSLRALVRAG